MSDSGCWVIVPAVVWIVGYAATAFNWFGDLIRAPVVLCLLAGWPRAKGKPARVLSSRGLWGQLTAESVVLCWLLWARYLPDPLRYNVFIPVFWLAFLVVMLFMHLYSRNRVFHD